MSSVINHGLISGFNFGYLASADFWASAAALEEVRAMADAGVRVVSLNLTMMQETFHSTRIFADYHYTADDRSLARVIEAIHAAGMQVILKPQIECHDSSWRGMIGFPDGNEQIQGVRVERWPEWFASYTAAICHYARLAEELGCAYFTVAQELAMTELRTDDWLAVIAAVRSCYHGCCVVNAMGDPAVREHPDFIRWARELDVVGFSNYHEVHDAPATAEAIREDVIATALPTWRRVAAALGKPVYWAECGCRSVIDGHRKPWEYRHVADCDEAVQAAWIEGFLSAWQDEAWWCGYQLWKWDEQQVRPQYVQPGGDAGFTIRGKQAETMLAALDQQLLASRQ